MSKVNGIEDLEELKAAAASQGSSIPNYNDWHTILSDFEQIGIKSTGSYDGDVALHTQLRMQAEQMAEQEEVEQAKDTQQVQQAQPNDMVATDKNQVIKSNAAIGSSDRILADLLKLYHGI